MTTFEKDHLGNVRVMITDQLQTDAYAVASLEAAQITKSENTMTGLTVAEWLYLLVIRRIIILALMRIHKN
jgi:hypothetical protein